MSNFVVSKEDIDAIVTVALRWTESGALDQMPPQAAEVLRVTRSNANEVGERLWSANHDSVNYGGPRDLVDPEVLAEAEEYGEVEEMPAYTFVEFVGTPAPEVVMRLTTFYQYQTQCEHWDERYLWPNGVAPFAARFIVAMEWYARTLLGLSPRDRVPGPDEERPEFPQDRFPAYQRVPWGLGEGDRHMFESIA